MITRGEAEAASQFAGSSPPHEPRVLALDSFSTPVIIVIRFLAPLFLHPRAILFPSSSSFPHTLCSCIRQHPINQSLLIHNSLLVLSSRSYIFRLCVHVSRGNAGFARVLCWCCCFCRHRMQGSGPRVKGTDDPLTPTDQAITLIPLQGLFTRLTLSTHQSC